MNVTAIPYFYDKETGKQVNAYSIFVRGKNKGKKIHYVRLRNRNGEKLSIHISTHKTTYNEAEQWVISNYDALIREYDNSLINRNDKGAKILLRALSEYFKEGSKWLLLDKKFGIERLAKSNREYDSLIDRHLVTYFNENHLYKYSDITAKVLYEFQIDCISKQISNKNISDMLFALKLLFNRLMAQGTIESSPFIGIKQVKREKSKDKGMFDINKVKGIFKTVWNDNETEYMFHLIACTTGLRNSEIRLLKITDFLNISDIHFVDVNNARDDNSGVKTENALRKIPVHNFVYERIQDYIKKNNRTEYVFLDKDKLFSASDVSNMIEIAANKISVDINYCKAKNITFHSWRHMFSTVLYESGLISSDWIEYFMGHKQKGVKAIYTHLNTVEGTDTCQKMLQVLDEKIIN